MNIKKVMITAPVILSICATEMFASSSPQKEALESTQSKAGTNNDIFKGLPMSDLKLAMPSDIDNSQQKSPEFKNNSSLKNKIIPSETINSKPETSVTKEIQENKMDSIKDEINREPSIRLGIDNGNNMNDESDKEKEIINNKTIENEANINDISGFNNTDSEKLNYKNNNEEEEYNDDNKNSEKEVNNVNDVNNETEIIHKTTGDETNVNYESGFNNKDNEKMNYKNNEEYDVLKEELQNDNNDNNEEQNIITEEDKALEEDPIFVQIRTNMANSQNKFDEQIGKLFQKINEDSARIEEDRATTQDLIDKIGVQMSVVNDLCNKVQNSLDKGMEYANETDEKQSLLMQKIIELENEVQKLKKKYGKEELSHSNEIDYKLDDSELEQKNNENINISSNANRNSLFDKKLTNNSDNRFKKNKKNENNIINFKSNNINNLSDSPKELSLNLSKTNELKTNTINSIIPLKQNAEWLEFFNKSDTRLNKENAKVIAKNNRAILNNLGVDLTVRKVNQNHNVTNMVGKLEKLEQKHLRNDWELFKKQIPEARSKSVIVINENNGPNPLEQNAERLEFINKSDTRLNKENAKVIAKTNGAILNNLGVNFYKKSENIKKLINKPYKNQ